MPGFFVSRGMPRTPPTPLLAPRTWQRRLHYGRFRRNSLAVKPFIWFFQQQGLRERTMPVGVVRQSQR